MPNHGEHVMYQYAETNSQSNAQLHPESPEAVCQGCGSVPAVRTTFRGHRGMIVLMQFLSRKGYFCRNCGLATFRQMTAATLVQGWWGYASFVITPIIVILNLVRRQKVAALAEPQSTVYSLGREPLNPGASLLQRPMGIAGVLISTAVVAGVVALFAH
jgi:uncharacterized protein YjhX (UPF0386 family)